MREVAGSRFGMCDYVDTNETTSSSGSGQVVGRARCSKRRAKEGSRWDMRRLILFGRWPHCAAVFPLDGTGGCDDDSRRLRIWLFASRIPISRIRSPENWKMV